MLETIELPGTGRRTTRIGFGCSGLLGGLSERESLRLLETAFDAGVRHFDVAPSYGHGLAERCVGTFLRGKTDQVTVTTKYGILPPPGAGLLSVARKAVRPIAAQLPSLRRRLGAAAATLKGRARFSHDPAQRSLENSLRELGVERVDLWLLHEATADDLDGSDLLAFLDEMRAQSRVGMYGLGSERNALEAAWQRHPEYCKVLQFEWSVLDRRANFPGAFTIHHRTILQASSVVREMFARDSSLCRRWSGVVEANLAEPQVLAALLVRASLAASPGTMVLFSSRNPAHIRANLLHAGDPAWAGCAQRLLELLNQRP